MADHESGVMSYSDEKSLDARFKLFELLFKYPGTNDERERSLGLFIRGSLLARILAIADLYKFIIQKPGIILDIGTWRGQTAIICENLRAIYEPLHFNRRIICFDTFKGYKGFSDKDKSTNLHREGSYDLGGSEYADYLNNLLMLHEKNNIAGHNHGKHKVIQGDCTKTIPIFLSENPSEFISLSFFDLNAYNPTLDAFNHVWSRTIPGGIVAFWQLSRNNTQAEGRVYNEHILNLLNHEISKSNIYPGLCYLTKK